MYPALQGGTQLPHDPIFSPEKTGGKSTQKKRQDTERSDDSKNPVIQCDTFRCNESHTEYSRDAKAKDKKDRTSIEHADEMRYGQTVFLSEIESA
jgi:hypothetical protein